MQRSNQSRNFQRLKVDVPVFNLSLMTLFKDFKRIISQNFLEKNDLKFG